MMSKPTWQIKKVADEGTSEPFVARVMLGALTLREQYVSRDATSDSDRERRQGHSDEHFRPVLDALGAARAREKSIRAVIGTHATKVADGSIISRQRNAIQINEAIDDDLKDQFSSFLSASVQAAKSHQTLLSYLGVEVGSMFQKESNFQSAIEALRQWAKLNCRRIS